MNPTEHRIQLLRAGYAPLPVVGKQPPFDAWQEKTQATADEIVSWPKLYPFAPSTGLLTRLMPTFDIDILNEAASEAVEALVRERFGGRGKILVRIGRAPKRAIPFRTDTPFDKITQNFLAPDASTDQKLELLSDGQQVVAFGLHKDTKLPYTWSGGEPGEIKLDELPYITEAEANQLVADATKLVCEAHGYQPTKARPPRDGGTAGSEDWSYLIKNIRDGIELHDSTRDLAAKLVVAGTSGGAAVNLLRAEMELSIAPRDKRFQERFDDLPNLVTSAQDKYGAGIIALNAHLLQSSAEFVAGFVPPDYLIDGWLQRRFVYSITGMTGHGKTTVMLYIAVCAALGIKIDSREVEKCRVLFFAGENPDDIRMRWIKLCEEMERDPADIDVFFLPGTPPISDKEICKRIYAETTKHGPFGLLIIDTSAAYFQGDDENSNTQLGNHARMLRSFVNLPGGPTVVVTCHPTKNPSMDNLLPRGGGAFLAEVDGNLVCIKGDGTVSIHWHGKLRGPDFAPILFKLKPGTTEKLKDKKGRLIWTITATPITEAEKADIEDVSRARQNELLMLLEKEPKLSLSEMAVKLDWQYKTGMPNTSLAHRMVAALVQDKLVVKKRGKITLTKTGAEEVAAAKKAKEEILF
jgi:hypothetical protein